MPYPGCCKRLRRARCQAVVASLSWNSVAQQIANVYSKLITAQTKDRQDPAFTTCHSETLANCELRELACPLRIQVVHIAEHFRSFVIHFSICEITHA